jgi:catechol 2,3-dioxygenase-like lactoylglutathione lyase family enzyme
VAGPARRAAGLKDTGRRCQDASSSTPAQQEVLMDNGMDNGMDSGMNSGRIRGMIGGAHVIVYSKDAAADRAFFRDVLGLPSVDAGHGWLIFALPPAEAAFHPGEENNRHELYLMCDDLPAVIAALAAKGVACSPVASENWGTRTQVPLPGGGEIGLYQPRHPTALDIAR